MYQLLSALPNRCVGPALRDGSPHTSGVSTSLLTRFVERVETENNVFMAQYDNWAEAQALCDSLGGFLAEPSTEESAEVLVRKPFFYLSFI